MKFRYEALVDRPNRQKSISRGSRRCFRQLRQKNDEFDDFLPKSFGEVSGKFRRSSGEVSEKFRGNKVPGKFRRSFGEVSEKRLFRIYHIIDDAIQVVFEPAGLKSFGEVPGKFRASFGEVSGKFREFSGRAAACSKK